MPVVIPNLGYVRVGHDTPGTVFREAVSVWEVSQVEQIASKAGTTITGMKINKTISMSAIILILVSDVVMIAGGQSPTNDRGGQDTQVRGNWTDPATGLMWAGKDNGKDVSWKKAMKYCRDLRLAGYSDWRLATLGELEGIYEKDTNAPVQHGM